MSCGSAGTSATGTSRPRSTRNSDGSFRILILRDHVIRDMLRGLGATVTDVSEPFHPEDGAYAHSHGEPAHALLNR